MIYVEEIIRVNSTYGAVGDEEQIKLVRFSYVHVMVSLVRQDSKGLEGCSECRQYSQRSGKLLG